MTRKMQNRSPRQVALDYARIERALLYIQTHFREQPGLDEIAAAAALSPCHFQRVFTRWAGVSPTRFLGYLTLAHAKAVLDEASSVLEASCAVGLSGPSRLHDLFVTYDAITPGQYKAMGSGLEIRYGVHTGLFGDYLAASTDRGLCALRFLGDGGKEAAVAELRHEFPGARLLREEDETIELCARHLAAKPLTGPGQLRLFCKGTNFQIRVWAALLSMPTGALATYGDIARAVGAPKAARAVGSAVAANPVAALIPCHRVIRATRLFQTDYRWGSARKLAMIGWEQAQRSKSCDFDL